MMKTIGACKACGEVFPETIRIPKNNPEKAYCDECKAELFCGAIPNVSGTLEKGTRGGKRIIRETKTIG